MSTMNIFDLTDTWNAAGTTFNAIKMNVTDTASAAGSLLMDLQVGGSSKFKVAKNGTISVIGATANDFTDYNANGIYYQTNAVGGLFQVGESLVSGGCAVQVGALGTFSWRSTNRVDAGTADTILARDAANTLAQRNGVNAQTFRLYNTFTDASNHERVAILWSGNDVRIQTEKAGTGLARSIIFGTDASSRWLIGGSTGHFLAGTDNTYDIGASGANRPRFLHLGGGSLTGAAADSSLTISPTWNTTGTPTAIKSNITDTASNAASLLMDLQVGGASQFSVRKDGRVNFKGGVFIDQNGTAFFQAGTFTNRLDVGIYGQWTMVASTYAIGWSSALPNQANMDLSLFRDAANTLAQRNGTNAQAFRLYNTFTDASNFERGKFEWASNVLRIGTEKAGTGTARALELQTDGVTRLTIGTNGQVTLFEQLILGIGGILRTRYINNGDNALTFWDFDAGSGGAATFGVNATTPRMRFGGTTSSFPALKRSTTSLQVRLADDSADAPLTASTLTATSATANDSLIAGSSYSLTGSSSVSMVDLAGTWNTTGTPTAIKSNITDTASNAASLLMDLQVGGSSRFKVQKNGRTTVGESLFAAIHVNLVSDTSLVRLGASFDTVLARDAANTLAQRNGTNAQAFNIYNTFTDASNYERGEISWSGNVLTLGTTAAGTGTGRPVLLRGSPLNFAVGGTPTTVWQINASGHFLAATDNTYDIGASGATRPRNVYVGTTVFANSAVQLSNAGSFQWATRGAIVAPSDGVFGFQDNAGTSFGRLQFGGTTSSFPALKRSTTSLQVRLADDSGFASISGLVDLTATQAANSIGTRGVPQNSRSADYTLVAADAGQHILHPSADTTARTFTIPANSTVAFPIGTVVTFINQNAGGVITIATTDTMRLAGVGTTGSRTLAANGIATAIKLTSTEWIISGTGLS